MLKFGNWRLMFSVNQFLFGITFFPGTFSAMVGPVVISYWPRNAGVPGTASKPDDAAKGAS